MSASSLASFAYVKFNLRLPAESIELSGSRHPGDLCLVGRVLDLIALITSDDPAVRNTALERACHGANAEELLAAAARLDAFRRRAENLYERVRALLFLASLHRYQLPPLLGEGPATTPPAKDEGSPWYLIWS